MKCDKCGFENKNNAKFCTKCGSSLTVKSSQPANSQSNNFKYIVIALVAIIIILGGLIGFLVMGGPLDLTQVSNDTQQAIPSQATQSPASSGGDEDVSTQSVSSTEVVDEKSWESIGSYSGSGSGSQTISVPAGKIMVKLSAYPIKNYATNHLYVTGSNGESGGVDWGSKSAVETRSDSFTYTSSSEEVFTIDFYETVNWQVEFFRYQ
ncbi:zinc ribbon domain-containing protein [Methanobrevibacter sp.]